METQVWFCWVCLFTSILFASHYNSCVLASAKYPSPRGLATLGQYWLVGTCHLSQWHYFYFYFIEVQCKHKILQTLTQPSQNRINLSKMHFLVKVQLFHSSHLAGGNSGSGIPAGLVTRCSSKDPQPAHWGERESSEWQAKRTVNLSHFSLLFPLIN